jgi:catechol-2,3-dioxygenase
MRCESRLTGVFVSQQLLGAVREWYIVVHIPVPGSPDEPEEGSVSESETNLRDMVDVRQSEGGPEVDPATVTEASAGPTLNHLVINVMDLHESERFYTEVLGFERVGILERNPDGMRFYAGKGNLHHHALALVQLPNPEQHSVPQWDMLGPKERGINHIAIAYPDREAWLKQLAWMQKNNVEFKIRLDHGMTHSVYITDPNGYGLEILYELPQEVWEGDINAALNYAELVEGDPLVDNTDYKVFQKA